MVDVLINISSGIKRGYGVIHVKRSGNLGFLEAEKLILTFYEYVRAKQRDVLRVTISDGCVGFIILIEMEA
jgi:hypothetical protein